MQKNQKLRLRDLRNDKDMTQSEVADIIKTSANYYGEYENGKREIPIDRILLLAEFYNVSLDYITRRTNVKSVATNENVPTKYKPDETALISMYKTLSDRQKRAIHELVRSILDI